MSPNLATTTTMELLQTIYSMLSLAKASPSKVEILNKLRQPIHGLPRARHLYKLVKVLLADIQRCAQVVIIKPFFLKPIFLPRPWSAQNPFRLKLPVHKDRQFEYFLVHITGSHDWLPGKPG